MGRYILYDYLQLAGGAERLTLDLVNGLPGYELVVSRIFPQARLLAPLQEIDQAALHCLGTPITRGLGRIPEAMLAFRQRTDFLRDAEVVLYSGFYAPAAVSNQQRGRRVYYCHTPPRYAYDSRQRYLDRVPALVRPAASLVISTLRNQYESALAQMDKVVANSDNVRGRLETYLGIEAEVVHPPIDTERFRWLGQDDYFISLARLDAYKRVDLIVKAFLAMPDQKLLVVSGGVEEANLKKLANGAANIFFMGWQTEESLRELLGLARAAIYVPIDEDFGMSPVEAMSAGKPVIGVNDGGLTETLLDGVTGVLLPKQISVEALIDAVNSMTAVRALGMRAACEARAKLFSKQVFLERMRTVLGG
ncbi:glycosyltransferase [soil metagenome]